MPSPCHPLLFLLRNRSCHFIFPWGSCSSPHNCCISWLRNLLRLVRNSFWMFSTIIFGSKWHLSTFEHQKGARPLFASGVNLIFFCIANVFSLWLHVHNVAFEHLSVGLNTNKWKSMKMTLWETRINWSPVSPDVSDVSDVSDVNVVGWCMVCRWRLCEWCGWCMWCKRNWCRWCRWCEGCRTCRRCVMYVV